MGEPLPSRGSDPGRFSRAVRAMQADWPTRFPLRDDPYAVVRWEVVLGTTLPGVPDDEAIPHLTRYLHDEDAIVRAYARWALDNRLRNGPPVSETG